MLNYRERVDSVIDRWLDQAFVAPTLKEAMRYSTLNGGKRVRPLLVYATANALKKAEENNELIDASAAAIECIHAYSLIHDDLPAMDDDDLRRGKPTCHKKFDEATAILAGDALQTLAFEKLSSLSPASRALNLIYELSAASGANGMVGGQVLDLLAEGKTDNLNLSSLEKIHRHKTGALIRASVRMGAIAAGATDAEINALSAYAESIGLAFQVQDDIIDVYSDTETLGKPQGSDLARGKATYVSLLGVCAAQDKAEGLIDSAKAHLDKLDLVDNSLRQLADYIIDRRS